MAVNRFSANTLQAYQDFRKLRDSQKDIYGVATTYAGKTAKPYDSPMDYLGSTGYGQTFQDFLPSNDTGQTLYGEYDPSRTAARMKSLAQQKKRLQQKTNDLDYLDWYNNQTYKGWERNFGNEWIPAQSSPSFTYAGIGSKYYHPAGNYLYGS